ncbi:MAG: ABC-F family ATP-binding cassette domain-containing protein [candidate division Zixibacteria bacterium]|nr:ABC-F family ATP-binding cassette domain-containing protein [candidate division Zixibacteria bacterium]
MPLVSFHQVSKYYGAQDVLGDIAWGIDAGRHIGLIGPNGAGKTTLLKLITGALVPDIGAIARQSGCRIGYLTQDPDLDSDATVLEEALSALSGIHTLERRLRETEHALENANGDAQTSERLLARYGRLQEEFERAGGYAFQHRAEAVLAGLGFPEREYARPVGVLSGGQKTRLGLAKLLLTEADLLLLDEPESHLDMNATEWLEKHIREYAGAVLLVSHDRYFLDRTVNEIVEVERRTLNVFSGNYSRYLELKTEQLKTQTRVYEQQQQMITRTEEFIRRNIAGQKTRQAQGRRKQLERLERIDRPAQARRAAGFAFHTMNRSGDDVLRFEGVAKGYEGRMLFTDLSLLLRRGERIGVIGPNGCGKTTLLRLIMGEETPEDGVVHIGAGVKIGYYDQERIQLSDTRAVLNELWSAIPGLGEESIRTVLGRFLFSGDDVFKLVGSLSGGEQARLALAKLMLENPNFLVLDEPTNHLDIRSRHALEQALDDYPGTLLVVSHDRYFLDNVIDELLVFEPSGPSRWPGDYSSYHDSKEETPLAETTVPTPASVSVKTAPHPSDPHASSRKRYRKTAETLETAIQTKEAEIAQIEQDLNDERVFTDPVKVAEAGKAYTEAKEALEQLYREWEVVSMELERL